ncbi:MAG TPA: 1-acyl-sn-glycerol-3-phosphate acyltransferase, partial [Flavisolibacter sp.]|nr:1-acyl-sn-glycerol-3-phosphate acyltransferase [Flavisolibacter sp.]
MQPQRGPTILACNHPNSFLDALIIGSHYKHPIHFLARGDVFAKPFIARLLRQLNMMPVHRLSEGREGLKANEQTFLACLNILDAGGTVLIFSESICKNQQELLPLKKGTARLAYMAWHEQTITALAVKPVALLYSGFKSLPIGVEVSETAGIQLNDVGLKEPARFYNDFNLLLRERLNSQLHSRRDVGNKKEAVANWRKWLLVVPAGIG